MLSNLKASSSSLTVAAHRCCRAQVSLSRFIHASSSIARQGNDNPPQRHRPHSRSRKSGGNLSSSFRSGSGAFRGPPPQKKLKDATPDRIRAVLSSELRRWIRSTKTLDRLHVIGLEADQSRRLLSIFAEEEPRHSGGWFPPEEDQVWQIQRVVDDAATDLQAAVDGALTKRFLQWTLDTLAKPGRRIIPPASQKSLEAVYDALDYTHPPSIQSFRGARMLRRTIHMHVGPTNSGKTHNALRALAASKHGVYASPLRLLAHECFERLNRGQICPAGVDENSDPKTWKRACNLLTGEEVRDVDPQAGLLSCTIEMLKFHSRYDVAVVDEIQMLADPERGGAWTAAVLGLHAKEIHLCGEEAAVPLVKKMLEETGDDIVVHKYDRLTPLVAAPKSLRDDLKNIQKGDCIVSFSRTKLFELKQRIEKVTGMRCAIIYGRLPPEVRAEQAELFNTPGNGYDVLVGSDAIGMGLNLKIKRIVFETINKFDGRSDVKLSLSQLKQIAGRAGRYGLHSSDSSGGVVTTLSESDLSTVRKAVATPIVPSAKRAILPTAELCMLNDLMQVLREGTGLKALYDLQRTAARVPDWYALRPLQKEDEMTFEAVDGTEEGQMGSTQRVKFRGKTISTYALHERARVLNAPIQWRDASVHAAAKKFLRSYGQGEVVQFRQSCEELGVFHSLQQVNEMRAKASVDASLPSSLDPAPSSITLSPLLPEDPLTQHDAPSSLPLPIPNSDTPAIPLPFQAPQLSTLLALESLYRIAVVYMWFSLRLPLIFSQRDDAVQVKRDCEVAIEWCLEVMRAKRKSDRMKKLAKTEEGKEKIEDEKRTESGVGGEWLVEDGKVKSEIRETEVERLAVAS